MHVMPVLIFNFLGNKFLNLYFSYNVIKITCFLLGFSQRKEFSVTITLTL
jgi:hypothetical protein